MAWRARQRSENRRAGGLKGRDRGWLPGSSQANAIGIPAHLVNKVRERTTTLVTRDAASNIAGGLTEPLPSDFGNGDILIDTRSLVVKTNQLSGIGRYRSQFNVDADGIKYARYYLPINPNGAFEETIGECKTKCEKARPNSVISIDSNNLESCCINYIKSIYSNSIPQNTLPIQGIWKNQYQLDNCLLLNVIYMPLSSNIIRPDYTISKCVIDLLGQSVLWNNMNNKFLNTGFRYSGINKTNSALSFKELLNLLPNMHQIWAPDYYAALPNYVDLQNPPNPPKLCGRTLQPTACQSCADFGGGSSYICTDLIIGAINQYNKNSPNQFYLNNINGMRNRSNFLEVQNHAGSAVFPGPTLPPFQWWFYSAVGSGIFVRFENARNKNLVALNKFHAIDKARRDNYKLKSDSGSPLKLPTVEEMLEKSRLFYSQFIYDMGENNIAPQQGPILPPTGQFTVKQEALIDYLNPLWKSSTNAQPVQIQNKSIFYKGWANLLCGAKDDNSRNNGIINYGTTSNPLKSAEEIWTLFTAGTFTDGSTIVWKIPGNEKINNQSYLGIDTIINTLTDTNYSYNGNEYDVVEMLTQPNKQGGFTVEMVTSKKPIFYKYNNNSYNLCPNLNKAVSLNQPWECVFCQKVGPSVCPRKIFLSLTDDNIRQVLKEYLDPKTTLGVQSEYNWIGNWDVSQVTNMRALFKDTTFNENIKNWDTYNVIDMEEMFENATKFQYSLIHWNTDSLQLANNMFNGATKLLDEFTNLDISPPTGVSQGAWDSMWL